MKIYSSGSLVMAIFAALMGAFLTWSFVVGGNLGEAVTAGLCWYAVGQGLYIAFVPNAKERDEQFALQKKQILNNRFGWFGGLVGYMPLLVFFIGIVVAMLVSNDTGVRGLIILICLAAAAIAWYKMQKWLLEELDALGE